jgi:hypothetical protein
MLTWHRHRYPEALTPVTHAISGRTSREVLLYDYCDWRGEAANTALPLRQILLTAWSSLSLLPISLDTRTDRGNLTERPPRLPTILAHTIL